MTPYRALFLLAAAPVFAAQDPDVAVETARLDVSTSPLFDLYFEVRSRAATDEELAEEDPLRGVILAARALDAALGADGVSIVVDGNLALCESAADLVRILEGLPETVKRPDGAGGQRVVELAPLARALGQELAAAEERWLKEEWPARKVALEESVDELEALLPEDVQSAVFPDIERWMGVAAGPITVPVRLVTHMPPPGGITLRTPRSTLSIIAVEGLEGTLFAEVVVHEAIHAIVFTTRQQRPLIYDVTVALQRAGLKPRSNRSKDSAHALFFLAADDLVRRHVDAEHRAYGDVTGLYDRIADIIAVERPLWQQYAAGELARRPFVLQLTEGIVALKGQKKSADEDR